VEHQLTRAFRFLLAFAVFFAFAPVSDAGWPSSGRVYPPSGGGACSQATTFLARTSGLSGTQTSAYTALICGMVTDGTWSVMDGLYVFATNSTATANLNLVSTSYGLTQNGTVTFAANNGYTGDGLSGYFTTGFTPSTAGGNMSTNSASIGGCVLTSRTTVVSNMALIGGVNAHASYIVPYGTTVHTEYDINDNDNLTAVSNAQGSWIASLTSSSQGYYAHNGSSTSFAASSNALADAGLYISALDVTGSPLYFSADQIAYAFYGGGLTTTQITAVYNRLLTYLSTVGAASGC
jgi:hypothetical protein